MKRTRSSPSVEPRLRRRDVWSQTRHGRRDARTQRRTGTSTLLPHLATLHRQCASTVEQARRSMLRATAIDRVRLAVLRATRSSDTAELARCEARVEQHVRDAQSAARVAIAYTALRFAVYSRALERRGGAWDRLAAEIAIPEWLTAADPWDALNDRDPAYMR